MILDHVLIVEEIINLLSTSGQNVCSLHSAAVRSWADQVHQQVQSLLSGTWLGPVPVQGQQQGLYTDVVLLQQANTVCRIVESLECQIAYLTI